MILRQDQRQLVDQACAALGSGSTSVLMVAPTSFGKTPTLLAIAEEIPGDGSILFVAHRDRLAIQAMETMHRLNRSLIPRTVFLNSASPRICRTDILIVDEAHHAPTKTMERIRADAKPRVIIAATATELRQDQFGLRFETVLHAPMHDELIEGGVLSTYEHFALSGPMDPMRFVQAIITAPHRWGPSILFVSTVDAAYDAVSRLRAGGVAAMVALGDASKEIAISALNADAVQVLVTVHALTEGVDVPKLQTVFIREGHPGAVQQAVGRVLRRHEGKVANVVQFAEASSPFFEVATPSRRWISTNGVDWHVLPPEPRWLIEAERNEALLIQNASPSVQDAAEDQPNPA